MATYAVAYEALSNQTPSPGGLRYDQLISHFSPSVPFRTIDSLWDVPRPPVPLSAYTNIGSLTAVHPMVQVDCRLRTDDASVAVLCQSFAGQDHWEIDGATVAQNAVGDLALVVSAQAGETRLAPQGQIRFTGAASAALGAAVGTTLTMDILAKYQYGPSETWQGLAHFCEFEEEPPDTQGDGTVRLNELTELIANAGSRYLLGTTSGGVATYAYNCGFTGMPPDGSIYIRPEDIGPNIEQIPAAVEDNTAASFRFHPTIFMRRTKYHRGLTRQVVDYQAIDTQFVLQPFRIVVVDSAPTTTNWLIIVDGTPQIVTVEHGAGTDWRRPRDIWNNVWVPILQGSQAAAQSVNFGSGFAGTTGGAVASRLQFLEYARCLPIPGTETPQDNVVAQ
jgi:hypothetical protein